MKWLMGYTAAFCVLLLIIAQSVFLPSFFLPYFSWHYERRDIPAVIGTSHDELMYVTSGLLEYMRGRRGDLESIYARFDDGETRQFFTCPVEIIHMVDVMELYVGGFMIRNIAFWLFGFLVFAMAFFKYPILPVLAQCCREVVVGFLILLVILAAVVAWDFDSAFVMFHLIFFSNDYWMLEPAHSYLINMVPIEFFVEVSVIVGLLLLLFSSVIIALGTWYLRSIGSGDETHTVAKFR